MLWYWSFLSISPKVIFLESQTIIKIASVSDKQVVLAHLRTFLHFFLSICGNADDKHTLVFYIISRHWESAGSRSRSSWTARTHEIITGWILIGMGLLPDTPGNSGTFSPPPHVSDPDMHHGTCVTHVPWCMPGSLTNGFLWSRLWGKRSGVCATRNSTYLARGPWLLRWLKRITCIQRQLNAECDQRKCATLHLVQLVKSAFLGKRLHRIGQKYGRPQNFATGSREVF